MIGSIMNALDGISSALNDGKISWMDKQMLVFILKFIKKMAETQLKPKDIAMLIRVLKDFCSDIQMSLNGGESDPALKEVLTVIKDVVRSLNKILEQKKAQENGLNALTNNMNNMGHELNHGAQGVSIAGTDDVSSDSGEDDIVEPLAHVSPIHQSINPQNMTSIHASSNIQAASNIQASSKVGDGAKPGELPKNNDIRSKPVDSLETSNDGKELTEEEHQKIADLMLTLLEEVYMTMALDTPKLDGIINTLDKLKNRATPS